MSTTSTRNHLKHKLLSRFLPPLSAGIAANWVEAHNLTGRIILDPFGAAPDLSVEAARSGARLIVAANNPIARLLIEVAASPPTPVELRTIISDLAAIRVRDERLEPHISTLYQTICPSCESRIGAEAFLWEQDAPAPYARIIHCPQCDTSGEFPATETDIHNASQYSTGGLHHARALERVAPLNDPDRIHVEEALNVYPPRAVYALLTLVNKLDMLNLQPEQDRYLSTVLLSAFDQANTLWPYPVARERPRQLTVPPTYQENNIWFAIEASIAQLAIEGGTPLPITYWPALPPAEGGICIFEGRIRDLAEQISEIELGAILTAFPRPNQAFWSLSALWSGWLWGHEAVEGFRRVLRRRRYDWAWHTTAIEAALKSLKPALSQEVPILGVIGEVEPGFITAVLLAAYLTGLPLKDLNLFSEKRIATIGWQPSPKISETKGVADSLPEMIANTGRDYLIERGEPSNYLQLHTAILQGLNRENLFPVTAYPAESYTQTQQEIQSVLSFRHGFLRYGGSEKSLDVGRWWLTDDSTAASPLADRTELAVVNYLIQHPDSPQEELVTRIQTQFPGTLIPDLNLLSECLESYGENRETGWKLKEQDAPAKRREELSQMAAMIAELGEKLGFTVKIQNKGNRNCTWLDQNQATKFVFFISASALLGKYLIEEDPSPARAVIVIPGGRANLVMHKLQRDPRLQKIFEQGWQFLKYRQVRQLADSPILTSENLEVHLGLDPLTYTETQMRMF